MHRGNPRTSRISPRAIILRIQPGQAKQANQALAGSLSTNPQQPNQASGKKGKHDAAALNETEQEKVRARAKTHETKATTANRPSRAADSGTISLLRTVHARLHRADADYDGHRVRAMNHIATAIRHLGSASGATAGWDGGYNIGAGLGGGHMPQAESDQILHNAIFQLNQTQGSLGTGTTAAAHHHNAHTSINEAIHELQVALKIR